MSMLNLRDHEHEPDEPEVPPPEPTDPDAGDPLVGILVGAGGMALGAFLYGGATEMVGWFAVIGALVGLIWTMMSGRD